MKIKQDTQKVSSNSFVKRKMENKLLKINGEMLETLTSQFTLNENMYLKRVFIKTDEKAVIGKRL